MRETCLYSCFNKYITKYIKHQRQRYFNNLVYAMPCHAIENQS